MYLFRQSLPIRKLFVSSINRAASLLILYFQNFAIFKTDWPVWRFLSLWRYFHKIRSSQYLKEIVWLTNKLFHKSDKLSGKVRLVWRLKKVIFARKDLATRNFQNWWPWISRVNINTQHHHPHNLMSAIRSLNDLSSVWFYSLWQCRTIVMAEDILIT